MNFQIYKYKYISFGSSIEDLIYITTEKLPKKKRRQKSFARKKSDKIYSVNLHSTMEYSNVYFREFLFRHLLCCHVTGW